MVVEVLVLIGKQRSLAGMQPVPSMLPHMLLAQPAPHSLQDTTAVKAKHWILLC
jgi:hypothetical protein